MLFTSKNQNFTGPFGEPDPNHPIITLSDFRIQFQIQNAEQETPDNAHIRIYNLNPETTEKIIRGYSTAKNAITRGEFTDIAINAGYENGNYGVIFSGSIRQYKTGKEDAVTRYLDIYASSMEYIYNSIINTNVPKDNTLEQNLQHILTDNTDPAVNSTAVNLSGLQMDALHIIQPRGSVFFGMTRYFLRRYANTLQATWWLKDGQLVLINKTGYVENDIVELNYTTGLIGVPEQTDQGVKIKCLLNSNIQIGCLVHINNELITQTLSPSSAQSPQAYNKLTGLYFNALLNPDGKYRCMVVEHEGDTRGKEWYTTIIGLYMDSSTNTTIEGA